MSQFLPFLGAIFTVFALSFAMISLRFIIKREPFRGTCANLTPKLQNEIGQCSVCGRKADEACQMPATEGKA